MEIIIKIKKE